MTIRQLSPPSRHDSTSQAVADEWIHPCLCQSLSRLSSCYLYLQASLDPQWRDTAAGPRQGRYWMRMLGNANTGFLGKIVKGTADALVASTNLTNTADSQYIMVEYNSIGLVQDCSNSSALALELLQSCAKPLTWYWKYYDYEKCSILFRISTSKRHPCLTLTGQLWDDDFMWVLWRKWIRRYWEYTIEVL